VSTNDTEADINTKNRKSILNIKKLDVKNGGFRGSFVAPN